jgi:hypothetical protein
VDVADRRIVHQRRRWHPARRRGHCERTHSENRNRRSNSHRRSLVPQIVLRPRVRGHSQALWIWIGREDCSALTIMPPQSVQAWN